MNYRSSHRRYSVRKGVLRSFAKFTGKHLCQSLSFNKVDHFEDGLRKLLTKVSVLNKYINTIL